MGTSVAIFRKELAKMEPEFSRVLPAHIPIERMSRTINNAVSANKKLLDADRNSLWNAAMTACVLGLEPDGVTGMGYLVPYRNEVQFIPGYRGLVSLCLNVGYILEGHIVRKSDDFSFQYGTNPLINHAPSINMGIGTDNPIIAAYAVARANDYPTTFEVMDHDEIIQIRDGSSGYKAAQRYGRSTPWNTHFAEMARKTPIRKLATHLPLQVQKAVSLEAMFDQGKVTNLQGDNVEDATFEVVEPDPAITDKGDDNGSET